MFFSYKPWSWTLKDDAGPNINWTRESDNFERSFLAEDEFVTEMQQDPNLSSSITLLEDVPPKGPTSNLLSEIRLDDFGGSALEPHEIERQLLEDLPSEVRHTFTAFFPQNRRFIESVSQQLDLDVPVLDPLQVSQLRRDMDVGDQTNYSLANDENLVSGSEFHRTSNRGQRTSKSPRQPLTQLNVTDEGAVALDPINIQSLDQIPVEAVNELIDEIEPPQVTEIPVQVDAVEQVQDVQLVLPEDFDIEESVRPPRRQRAPPVSLSEHQVAVNPRLRRKKHRFTAARSNETDLSPDNRRQILNEMNHRNQPETMHLLDVLDEFLSVPQQQQQPLSSQLDPPTILRPSDCHVKQPIPRRTSTILDQIHESQIPVLPTVANILTEEQQHLDSAVINAQEINNDMLRIQRTIGQTPPRINLNEYPFLHEVPTMTQIRQVEEMNILNTYQTNHPNEPLPGSIPVPAPVQETQDKPKYTENEKYLLGMFFKILTLKSFLGRLEFALSEVIGKGGDNARKFVTLLSKYLSLEYLKKKPFENTEFSQLHGVFLSFCAMMKKNLRFLSFLPTLYFLFTFLTVIDKFFTF